MKVSHVWMHRLYGCTRGGIDVLDCCSCDFTPWFFGFCFFGGGGWSEREYGLLVTCV